MTPRTSLAVPALVICLTAGPAAAQTPGQADAKPVVYAQTSPAPSAPTTTPGWARVSFFGDGAWSTYSDGSTRRYSELIATVAVQSPVQKAGGFEYHLDARVAGYPSSQHMPTRSSLYEGYVGLRWDDDRLGFRVGQLWLNDLGALGQVGGGVFEARWPAGGGKMRFRFGGFGGWEPDILTLKYATGVHKFGAYAVLESPNGLRRHVVGYVNIRDTGLTERSVITFQNFVPLLENKIFVYQAAEYDLVGPAGQGTGHLTYFFANGRVRPSRRFELQGTYHHGRSIDTRGITLDTLNGRPIDPKAVEGFMFESIGGRVSVEALRNVRVFAGYSRDRNNVGDPARERYQAGVWATNLLKTGLDLNITEWRNRQAGMTTYNSLFVSVGRNLTARVYVSGEYNQSVSTLRLLSNGSFTLLSRPETHRYAVSGMIRVTTPASVTATVERMDDASYREYRVMAGLVYRFCTRDTGSSSCIIRRSTLGPLDEPGGRVHMRLSRRTLLKTAGAGAAFALSGGLASRGRAMSTSPASQRKARPMEINRAGSQPSRKGTSDWFTGTVRIDPLFEVHAPSRGLGINVTFEPGARTHWHTHPLGQNLIITGGCGWVQRWGGPVEEIRPGDTVWIPPGEKHWHGAAATTAMTHIAVYEHVDGVGANWFEPVTDAQYRR